MTHKRYKRPTRETPNAVQSSAGTHRHLFGCRLNLGDRIAERARSSEPQDLGVGKGCGVNNNGQVVILAGPLPYSFNLGCVGFQGSSIYSGGTITPLGMNGVAINASGQVAGEFNAPNGQDYAALYTSGTVTTLPTLDTKSEYFGLGLNASGTVVGTRVDTTETSFGMLWSNGTVTDIGTSPGGSYCNRQGTIPNAINDSGEVTGSADTTFATLGCTNPDAFIYDNGTWTDLGPGSRYAINESGQVTGVSLIPTSVMNQYLFHAFLYSNGTKIDLGALPGEQLSAGFAINSNGTVVGRSQALDSEGSVTLEHAFFYNGVMNDLNAFVSSSDPLQAFVTLTDARGINDYRVIVVNGVDSRDKQEHAYLLQAPWINVAPGTLTFASTPVGTVSPTQSVTLTNAGTTSLALGTLSISGDFTQTNNCGASLVPSATCTVMVAFAPTAAGDLDGSLTVIAAGVPIVVSLSGTAPIKVAISSSAATVTTGVAVKLTWTASPGASCTATGGSANDAWTGSIAVSGTQAVLESTAGTYQYGLTCTAGSQMASGQVSVVVTPPPARSGGGGEMSLLSLVSLLGILGLRVTHSRQPR
jgi:probable HAF family extracellular repeat protein